MGEDIIFINDTTGENVEGKLCISLFFFSFFPRGSRLLTQKKRPKVKLISGTCQFVFFIPWLGTFHPWEHLALSESAPELHR